MPASEAREKMLEVAADYERMADRTLEKPASNPSCSNGDAPYVL
jgi:hypothetical protein